MQLSNKSILSKWFTLAVKEYGNQAFAAVMFDVLIDLTDCFPIFWQHFIKERSLENQWEATVNIPNDLLELHLNRRNERTLESYFVEPYYPFRNDDDKYASLHQQMVLNDYMSVETHSSLIVLRDLEEFFRYATDREYWVYDVDGERTDRRLDFDFINDIKRNLVWHVFTNVPKDHH